MVYVPAGEFTMGGPVDDAMAECQKFYSGCQRDQFANEEPPHIVTLDAFWIDQSEVTNKKYAVCVSDGGCDPPSSSSSSVHTSYYGNPEFDDHPVIHVSWNQAKAYCSWAGKRLPSEAEWEKAARGTDSRLYPWGDDTPDKNFVNYSNFGGTTPVGNFPDGDSFYGAFDMAGNVSEWVNDTYSATYYQTSPSSNPLGADVGQTRVIRGGSWHDSGYLTRSTHRLGLDPSYADFYLGFRCAG
jgi:formylglycine-generating enzyme required for sulfatase activity